MLQNSVLHPNPRSLAFCIVNQSVISYGARWCPSTRKVVHKLHCESESCETQQNTDFWAPPLECLIQFFWNKVRICISSKSPGEINATFGDPLFVITELRWFSVGGVAVSTLQPTLTTARSLMNLPGKEYFSRALIVSSIILLQGYIVERYTFFKIFFWIRKCLFMPFSFWCLLIFEI